MTPNPIPYAPPTWQLPRLAAAKPGEEVLLVAALEPQPTGDGDVEPSEDYPGEWFQWHQGDRLPSFCCPLGPVGSIIRIEGVGDFRNAGVDLRRTDSMTSDEFIEWGAGIIETLPNGAHGVRSAEDRWNQSHPSHPWGSWAWFVMAKKEER